jgi:integrase
VGNSVKGFTADAELIPMAIHKLSAKFVEKCHAPGVYSDGRGLALRVTKADQRSWIFRYTLRGRAHELGLGSLYDVNLDQARVKAQQLRALKGNGVDPLQAKQAEKAKARGAITFKQASERYIAAHRASWRSVKHAEQWESSLKNFAFPILGNLDVAAIDTDLVMRVLQPIWDSKTTTAQRTLNRIENVLGWCTVQHFRSGDNPAKWKGHLDHLLADPATLKKKQKTHFAAMPHRDVPSFMGTLRAQDDAASRALEFAILTAARTAEVVFADWQEINFVTNVWTIPPQRTKTGIEHRVPLSAHTLEILNGLPRNGPRIFRCHHGGPRDRVKKLGYTTHGFRSSFRDWCAEQTDFPREHVEKCLAHTVGSEVERSYQRSDLLDKRRDILTQWAAFCTGKCK